MRKRLLALVAALVLACSLAPGIALADEGPKPVAPVTIEIGEDGAPVGTSGDGWTYMSDKLTLDTGHAFTFTGSACNRRVDNYGTIVGGEFKGYVANTEGGIISGGTFNDYVNNFGIISGGTFNKGSGLGNNSVDNKAGGTICGGTINVTINNSGTIKGAVISHAYVQNYADGTIEGGAFDTEASVDGMPYFNFGTIQDGSFSCEISNMGTIIGGTFTGEITNYNTIEGGFFAHPVVDEDGTMSAAVFPVSATLTGVSIAEATDAGLFATYRKDSGESNRFTLVADEGYTLPEAVVVRCGTADGAELVAGADYAYDAASGIITIKQSAVTGPVFLVASGVPAAEPTPPEPTPPAPEGPESSQPTTPTPSPTPQATTLASTGDSPLPLLAAGVFLAACALAVLARKKLARW